MANTSVPERPLLSRGSGRAAKAAVSVDIGMKLANFDWPPPPSPASSSRPFPSSSQRKFGSSGGVPGFANDVESGETSVAPMDNRNRAELWEVRAEMEKEKLKMVAPFPFFGCPMRFSDELAALQIAQDGRFSYSEMVIEAADPDASSSRPRGAGDIKRVVTYEGVFSGPYSPPVDDEEQQAVASAAKAKEGNSEEPAAGHVDPEIAAIEATAMVKHETFVESSGRSRLALVERGAFRFAITVSPFFHPTYATVKVMARRPGQPAARGRRLPYQGSGATSKSCLSSAKRSSNLSHSLAAELRPRKNGGRLKISHSAALLPSAAMGWTSSADRSPFRRAAAGSLAASQSASFLWRGSI